jgi:PAS domain S-box-containing protein
MNKPALSNQPILDNIPIPFFILSLEGRIIYRNHEFQRYFRFDINSVIVKESFLSYFDDNNQSSCFLNLLKKKEKFNKVYKFVRDGGEIISGHIFVSPRLTHLPQVHEFECVLYDVTQEERYERTIDDLPVGYYEIKRTNTGEEIINNCNNKFAELFGYSSHSKIKGELVRKLYFSLADYKKFRKDFEYVLSGNNNKVFRAEERLKKINGDGIQVQIDVRGIYNNDDDLIGRYGIIRDISKEQEFKERLEILASDIGQILHAYSSNLISQKAKIQDAITLLSEGMLKIHKKSNEFNVQQEIHHLSEILRYSIKRFVDTIEPELESRGIPENIFRKIMVENSRLENYQERVREINHQSHYISLICFEIAEVIEKINQYGVPREPIKEIQRNIYEVLRVISLVGLSEAVREIHDMDQQLSSFREYVTTGIRPPVKKTRFCLWPVILQVETNLLPYTEEEGVVVRKINEIGSLEILAVERDILRSITNLLHNAVKYSWEKKEEETYVLIHAYIENENVVIKIENYGVPIPKDEIDEGLIYRVGYRGRLSTDRGRTGTGFGLKDAKTTAESHGGKLRVTSFPASGHDPNDYSQPFITRVYFKIRIS